MHKIGLYMNSSYWWKELIKLLNLTNSAYNFNNNDCETEKKCNQNYLLRRQSTLAVDHVPTEAVWGKGHKACYLVSTWARKPRWHVDTKRKHTKHVDTWGTLTLEARWYVSTSPCKTHWHVSRYAHKARWRVSTFLACRARNLAESVKLTYIKLYSHS